MSNIIQLLERMGQDAQLQDAQQLAQEIAQAEISAEQKQALVNQDAQALHKELDVCPDVVCLMVPDKPDEPDEDNDDKPDEVQLKRLA
ncbi:hypothetical protein EXU30_04675 [Shewanella maritima]|uniref:Uncharacterized protein n=1 Tax=Shewanella maritima TaxID=2520507 RepID=A0A411PER2_9GAMM|nr:hypothetical protein [Shewanella maritima]QBF82076.1 hypothetical protein EXU30_04675 [Shewanella maritima]